MVFLRLSWIVTLFAAIYAVIDLVLNMKAATSAPQQAAAAAMAAATCIIPYVFTRAVEALYNTRAQ